MNRQIVKSIAACVKGSKREFLYIMLNEEYARYKKIKSSLSKYCYKNISIEKLAGFNIAYMTYFFSSMTFIQKLKLVVNFLFFIPNVNTPDSEGTPEAIYGWSIKREDYKHLSDGYKREMGKDFTDLCLSFQGCSKKFRIDFKSLWYATKVILSGNGHSVKSKAIAFLSIYKSLSFLNYLEGNFNTRELKVYLSFNSSFDYESVFTLFLKDKEVSTYSMQHGMYFKYENSIPFDVVNYENATADFLLVWGGFSKQQITGYLPKECEAIVFGHPHHKKDVINLQKSDSNKILVGLPRQLYIEEIKKLLYILNSKDFAKYLFIVRPHPSNNIETIESILKEHENLVLSKSKNIVDELYNGGFFCFIGFNSSLLFEVAHYGLPVFQFVTGNDEFLKTGFYEFTSLEEFNYLLDKTSEAPVMSEEMGYFS